MRGTLIVIEGTDGSGKATQVKLLGDRLRQEGISFREIDFPRYGNPFAEPARLYLSGALGKNPGDVNAYAASVLYAVDRYASYREDWGSAYEAGEVILANRYTTSNAVHQASKLPEEQRNAYLSWLFDLEYDRMGLPKPDMVLYLDLPTEVSEQMMRRREAANGTKADIHEQDSTYLRACRENACQVVEQLKWHRVDCAEGGEIRTREDIHEEIWCLVCALLGHRP